MFRWIRRLILLAIFLLVAAVLLIILFPNRYEKESVIEINASVEQVFAVAEKLEQWNMYAMIGVGGKAVQSLKDPNKAKEIREYAGSLADKIENMNIRVEIVRTDFPKYLVYKTEGGPLNGIQPEMFFIKLDDGKTRVIHKEQYTFPGLTGSIKAFIFKYGTTQLTNNGLNNLKKICEEQAKSRNLNYPK